MTSSNRTDQLNELVKKAGSIRKAEQLILDLKGVAPSKSAIDRALKGSGTDYSVQCMIDDLTKALSH
ncbi:hypothetical protein [Vibrio sp. YT-17]|uniref:hypothetical protein n=1 Tax=Vibrio sp. YT-17 TaxID=3074708 RepID=UPI00296484AB|nr:hypothetical protein [Vibrio sp. YT-17]MDW1542447.1 hypothetical protein [Vibrio sp. YT-17]